MCRLQFFELELIFDQLFQTFIFIKSIGKMNCIFNLRFDPSVKGVVAFELKYDRFSNPPLEFFIDSLL